MKKALSLPLVVSNPGPWLWAILFGELGLAAVLLLQGGATPIATRALQLFLRF